MRILVFQHLAVEHPGVFRDFWHRAGHVWTVIELDEGGAIPDLEPFDLLVVMGGPMDVWQQETFPWLIDEIAAIRHWVRDLGRPFLGICLGHQLLGAALGGSVGLMARPEVGLGEVVLNEAGRADPLLSGLGASFQALHWHGAEVATLPEGAVSLAASALCPVQAMRWGAHAYGVQCHIEITEQTTAEWGAIPEYEASLEAALGADGAARLAADVAREIGTLKRGAEVVNRALTALVAGARNPSALA